MPEQDLVIREEETIEDIRTDDIKTHEAEKRKTLVTATANFIALLLIGTYIVLIVGNSFGIANPTGHLDRLESIIGVIIGFYFGKKLSE